MNHMSTLALCELLTQVVAELDKRGRERAWLPEVVADYRTPIETAWGDLCHDGEGWIFVYDSEDAIRDAMGMLRATPELAPNLAHAR